MNRIRNVSINETFLVQTNEEKIEKNHQRNKEKRQAYDQRPEVKARRRAYHQRPEVKARKQKYFQNKEAKIKKLANKRKWYQDNKEKKQEYEQTQERMKNTKRHN